MFRAPQLAMAGTRFRADLERNQYVYRRHHRQRRHFDLRFPDRSRFGPHYAQRGESPSAGLAIYPNAVNVTASSIFEQRRDVNFGNLSSSKTSIFSVAGGGVLNFTGTTTLGGGPTFNMPAGTIVKLAGPVGDGGSA